MKSLKVLLVVFISAIVTLSMSVTDKLPTIKPNSTVVINKFYDLQGATIAVPQGVTFIFKNGGFYNGTLKGCNTSLKGKLVGVFENIIIKGTWLVPDIMPSLFKNPVDDDVLCHIFALSSDSIHNRIYIPEGVYRVSAYKGRPNVCEFKTDTEVILDGEIL